jgi:hypothetical protein
LLIVMLMSLKSNEMVSKSEQSVLQITVPATIMEIQKMYDYIDLENITFGL